jgi:two-component system, cell cycle response regulator DivK
VRGTHVLIVDDVEDNRDMYAEFLRFAGVEVDTAPNAEVGLEKAFARPPGVVIMDLALPKMDGWTATRALREHPRTKHVPVIVVTGHVLPDHERRAFEAGANDVCQKPITPSELLGRVQRLMPDNADENPPNQTMKRRKHR